MDIVTWCHTCLWYFAICLQLSSSKEAIIKERKWFCCSYALHGIGDTWSTNDLGRIETCGSGRDADYWFISVHVNLNETFAALIYVDVEAELTLCGVKKPCYSNFFDVYIYRGQDSPVIPSEQTRDGKLRTKKFLPDHFSPIYNITNKTSPNALIRRQNQTFTFLQNKSKGVTFGIRSRGACGKIYRMKMYYYHCEEIFINSIKFENTTSPAHGSKQVLGNCSLNSLPSNNGTNLNGYCHSNGSWSINDQIKCLCIAGHEPNKKLGCSPCPTDYFKPNISNSICAKCRSNTNSNNNKTSCECKNGYYKFQNSSILSCYGLVQLNDNPTANFVNGNVTIRWSKASSTNSLKEQILYDVECYSCEKSQCNGHCVGENYDPGQFNLTQRSVVVSNLSSGIYVFRIYPKNSLNNVVGKEKWNFSKTDPINVIVTARPTPSQKLNTIKRSDSDSDYTTTLAVAIPTTAVVALLLGFLIGTFWERRKKSKNTETTFPVELESMPDGKINENATYAEVDPPKATDISSILALFQDVQRSDESFWEFPRQRLTMLRKLGEGSFGTVNKAKVTPIHAITCEKGGIVAVKMLKENVSLKDKRDFMSELNLMKKLEPHPHVVQLLGCCTNSEPFFLILEYLVGGDLLGYLRKSRGYEDPYNTGEYVPTSRLGEKDLLSFAWMISDGMNFLSSKEIVHRDLAARNVLVGEDNICKVSDFGLAREGSYERKSKARLPAKWMAPEDLLHGQCTSMSDIWSYGILLWEIFTIGDSPYPGFKGRDVFNLIESGYRMPKPSHFSDELYSLMMDCWNDEPIKRPKFSYISSFFHKMLDDFTAKAYLDLTKFDDYHYENFDAIE